MKLSDFDYNLPKKLIASSHIEPRGHSRLLVFDRRNNKIEHKYFYDIVDYLRKGDIIIFNNSKVFRARIFGSKKTGGKVEFLVIRPINSLDWDSLVRGKVRVGDVVFFPKGLEAEIIEKREKTCRVRFNKKTELVFKYLEENGEIPLPPYIEKKNIKRKEDKDFYQNIYAEKIGSVAAPTAGFHFTNELLKKIKKKGVECLEITLHVGPGTFLPVEVEEIEKHRMHEEFYEIEKKIWERILKVKEEKNRVIAVGTTTCRSLESAFLSKTIYGSTDIFIYPPYDFKIVDCLVTNFHLPRSTLLMLVSAFFDPRGEGGVKKIKGIYDEAINIGYRFYSFGDSMLIF